MNKQLDFVALLLVIVGAVNWGLVGLFKFDLVAKLVGEKFGTVNLASRIVYILVALSGVYLVSLLPRLGRSADRLTTSTSYQ
jgi:uncharacterized membrane protein YuzA (DUF378 family)